MDTLSINGEISVNVSGIGFDGHIASLFGKSGKRGLLEYVSLAATEFRKFKTFPISGTIDEREFQNEAFILAFANSSQFGNNATISPTASVYDQLMDICVIQKVPLLQALGFTGKMFTRRMHKSAFVKIIRAKKASFSFSSKMPFHIDGEGRESCNEFFISVVPSSLRILAPSAPF
jgi:diacylglycerol kinase family enzyme